MILQKEHKILRKKAEPVKDFKALGMLIKRMAEAMFAEPDGIGIAAPQIGASLQIFLVARDVFDYSANEKKNLTPSPPPLRKGSGQGEGLTASSVKREEKGYLVFINPIIKKLSHKKSKDVEGCLSVRGFYGEVPRAEKITIEYLDEVGKKCQRGASGLFARVIQHELDHLNGVLFIDKAQNLKKFQ